MPKRGKNGADRGFKTVGGEDLGGYLVGILLGGANLHEADAGVVDQQAAEAALLRFIIGHGRDVGEAERIFLLLAGNNRIFFVVNGIGAQLVLPVDHREINEQIEGTEHEPISGRGDIQDKANDSGGAKPDAQPLDQGRPVGVVINGFHLSQR